MSLPNPSFSIIMPTYQRREVVLDAVRSLAHLSYDGSIELIVVVDGATDGTAEALGRLSVPLPMQVLVQQNLGAAAARNAGADVAKNEILLFLDDDMMARADLVAQHAASHREGAQAVVGHTPVDPASPHGYLSRGAGDWAEERRHRLSAPGARLTFLDVMTGQLSVRREVFKALGGFDRTFTANGAYGNEDLDFGQRLIEAGCKVVFNPEAVSYQRYVVSWEGHLRQRRQAGRADVAFARMHPECAAELFELHGINTILAHLLIPLARVPRLADFAGRIALALVRSERSSRIRGAFAPRLFRYARELGYWRGVHEAGGVPRRRSVLILCYHSISDLSDDVLLGKYAVSDQQFARHLKYLHKRGYSFICGSELERYLVRGAGLPRRSVLITFDDCYEDLLTAAAPVLERYQVQALAFAVTDMVEGTNFWDRHTGGSVLRLLGWEELSRLTRQGVEIGAHSRRHARLSSLGDQELVCEVEGAADDLERAGLRRPRYFAYPYGVHNAEVRRAAAAAGYVGAFTLGNRRLGIGTDPMSIPRIEVTSSDVGWRFALKVAFPAVAQYLPS